jgi:hypothetical protein
MSFVLGWRCEVFGGVQLADVGFDGVCFFGVVVDGGVEGGDFADGSCERLSACRKSIGCCIVSAEEGNFTMPCGYISEYHD